ncbi:MAG: wax ester/triacylglycerol synthase domain-containing protein [Actinomycetota bacterium]
MAERELRFDRMMSDAEAMMWNIEHDPRLSSNIGSIAILDRPLNFDYLRLRVAKAVGDLPRMRERVAPVLGRLSPPAWIPDTEFDLDYHLRRISLPEPGSDRQLYDLCTKLLQEPLDRTRPLWSFVAIDGVSDGRGALFTKLHHTVADGEGAVRLAENYMELERDTPPPPGTDLAEIIAKDAAESTEETSDDFLPSLISTSGHAARRIFGIAKRTLGEAALVVADPARVTEGVKNLQTAVTSAQGQLGGGSSGSPIWKNRSRGRFFDTLDVHFDGAKEAAKKLGGSLNDFFVTGAALGAVRYHDFMGVDVPFFSATFVVSTRDDRSAGGNSFTPSKVKIPGGKMDPADRFKAIQESMGSRRGEVTGGADLMGAVSGLANLLPTSVVTGIARQQAGAVDFATSNVRGAPLEVYVSGGKILKMYPMGPVAGTAWNITMLSYAGMLNVGVQMDPAAVEDADLLMRSLREGYAELLAAGGQH